VADRCGRGAGDRSGRILPRIVFKSLIRAKKEIAIIVDGVAQQPRESGVFFSGKIAPHAAEMRDLTNSGEAG
jgi:hypothetical protein